MPTEAKFKKAVEIIGGLPQDGPLKPSQDDQLFFYKYYKQATVGDVNTARPGMLDFTGKAKWDAWKSVEGASKEESYKQYVERLVEFLKKAGDDAHIAEIEAA
ncbi:ACB domain-containing protein [Mycena indigotica]|uniref:ACB domain-containing protein n=1 Tax=Mycena indigotica TaxID=2126181 RepID=A0A8H6WF66_9AGAR|nr:ACB domain-containing protein [Mycena indigotica]KAF7312573.1 ACB domain-containing protein [Mycena indigotica]